MKTSLITNNISFGKNQYLKNGDDIQRHARKSFPAFSPTYADTFYHKKTKESPILEKKVIEVNTARDCVNLMTISGLNTTRVGTEIPQILTLNNLELRKKGNCEEFSIATLATLLANGYTDSERKYLCLRTEFINKETGQTEYYEVDSLDHALVVSSLGKNSKDEKDLYVIDSWLGFADTIQGAKTRYKNISDQRGKLSKICSKRRSDFRLKKLLRDDVLVDTDKYEQKCTLFFKDADSDVKKVNQDLQKYVNLMYRNLKLPQNCASEN